LASYAIALPWRGRIGSHEMRTEVGVTVSPHPTAA
jgi:hypothetical protein